MMKNPINRVLTLDIDGEDNPVVAGCHHVTPQGGDLYAAYGELTRIPSNWTFPVYACLALDKRNGNSGRFIVAAHESVMPVIDPGGLGLPLPEHVAAKRPWLQWKVNGTLISDPEVEVSEHLVIGVPPDRVIDEENPWLIMGIRATAAWASISRSMGQLVAAEVQQSPPSLAAMEWIRL